MRIWKRACLCLVLSLLLQANTDAADLKALIVDGQNNHAMWPKTTVMMKHYLEETGMFDVDVARTKFTWNGENLLEEFSLPGVETTAVKRPQTDPDFKPDFSKYDVVISNFGNDAAPWPEETKRAFEKYMQNGGGLVIVHAADNAFGDWPEYNRMIGLGGWGGRNSATGTYYYFNEDGQGTADDSQGRVGSHGKQHEYSIVVRDGDHPITNGMPKEWLHSQDELYDRLRGPGQDMQILATAYSSPQQGGTDRHEPMLMTIQYGQGRVFHTPMGHADYSVECVGFKVSLQRGCEWAATGKVTQEIPINFPTAEKTSTEPFGKN